MLNGFFYHKAVIWKFTSYFNISSNFRSLYKKAVYQLIFIAVLLLVVYVVSCMLLLLHCMFVFSYYVYCVLRCCIIYICIFVHVYCIEHCRKPVLTDAVFPLNSLNLLSLVWQLLNAETIMQKKISMHHAETIFNLHLLRCFPAVNILTISSYAKLICNDMTAVRNLDI